MIVKASQYVDRAKDMELDKARREGREIIERGVSAEDFRVNAKKLNWPAKSIHLKFNEAVAGPPHDARENRGIDGSATTGTAEGRPGPSYGPAADYD